MDHGIKTQQQAIDFQKHIYNEAVRNKSHVAFGDGILQEIYYEKRIKLAAKYSNKESTVLDLGCGDGTIAHALSSKVRYVDAIDVSEEAIKLAQRTNNVDNIHYVCAPMENYMKDKAYDLILMYESMEHIFNPEYMLSKIYNLLKPGGKLILSTPNSRRFDIYLFRLLGYFKRKQYSYEVYEDHVREYSYGQIKRMLEAKGFRIVTTEGLFLSLKMSCKLSKKSAFLRLMAKTGNLFPRLAHHLYFVVEK
ncbi:MAG: class I SAM-dependent methyltransferase [Candidatus Omnitrophica bacterium]|nr:class I SAM-dependent methyltransferase [Candidatus Omnitrophota bacterium]